MINFLAANRGMVGGGPAKPAAPYRSAPRRAAALRSVPGAHAPKGRGAGWFLPRLGPTPAGAAKRPLRQRRGPSHANPWGYGAWHSGRFRALSLQPWSCACAILCLGHFLAPAIMAASGTFQRKAGGLAGGVASLRAALPPG